MKGQTKKGSQAPVKRNAQNTKISDFFKSVQEKPKHKIIKSTTSKEFNEVPVIISDNEENPVSPYKGKGNISRIEFEVQQSPKKRKSGSEIHNCDVKHELNSPKRKCISPIASTSTNRSPLKQIAVTPVKRKKYTSTTPRKSGTKSPRETASPKLFQRTPQKVQDFCVEVMKNFVKITPSKSSCNAENGTTPTKSVKVQTTLLNFISPSTSNKSVEAQKSNERTPIKSVCDNSLATPSKAKTRLNFGDPQIFESDTIKENIDIKATCIIKNEVEDIGIQNSLDEFCISQFFDTDFEEESLDACSGTEQLPATLDLSHSTHCKVVKIEIFPSLWKLTVKSTKSKEFGVCTIKDFWLNSKLNIGDTIHILAKKINSEWLVDNNHGLIVYEPDTLISSTSLVNTLFCKRRSVLSDKFHGFEPVNEYMIVGTLVHSILQETLKKKLNTLSQIEQLAKSLLTSKDMIRRLYESNLSIEEAQTKISVYIPRILEFVESYVDQNKKGGKKRQLKRDCWQGTISDIEDIEENIWCPELGIKGKVDVSVKSNTHYMPLELKTGKASFSLEHKGQVLLYVMMMNKLGYKVPSGLLLYLRDGIMREITMSDNEKRDIIILRNELTYYLTRRPKVLHFGSEQEVKKQILPPELPEPINHHSACGKCPYNIVCTAFLEYNKDDLSSNRSLHKLKQEVLSHLEQQHLNYFIHWFSLINLEWISEKSSLKSVQEIYTKTPVERESKGKCISRLKITHISEEYNGLMDHTFVKLEESTFNFLSAGINEGSYSVISTNSRPAVVTGFVTNVDSHSITIALDRNLRKKHPFEVFHVDTSESPYGHSFNQTSLLLLLEPSARAEQLREIIIDKKVPTFRNKLPKVVAAKGLPILKRLNKIQQRAVLKAVSANDFLLIKGMPGTGKTETLVALIQLLSELGKSVLITSHTNSAVDNVCTRLLKLGVDFLRLGSEARINKSLKSHSEYFRTRNCTTPEEIAAIYNEPKVIASTCLGSGHPLLSKRTLDVCIVDESTQVLQTTLIKPLYAVNTFILIGDPEQLPPVVRSMDAVEMGMAESLFHRLESQESTISLTLNYRMNKTITELVNSFTYKGELLVANESVGNSTLIIPNKQEFLNSCGSSEWISKVLDTRLEKAVQIIDTGPIWKRDDVVTWNVESTDEEKKKCICNIYEAAIITHLTNSLLKGDVQPQHIGVIASFNSQVTLLGSLLSKNVDVSTVDQFQGRDKNVIFYSCGKSLNPITEKSKFEILDDHRRLNVALTRAKNKLVIVGDLATIKRYTPFAELLNYVKESHVMRLTENVDGFSWSSLLNNVKE